MNLLSTLDRPSSAILLLGAIVVGILGGVHWQRRVETGRIREFLARQPTDAAVVADLIVRSQDDGISVLAGRGDAFRHVVVIDEGGCLSCIVDEASLLERYWPELSEFTQVIFVGESPGLVFAYAPDVMITTFPTRAYLFGNDTVPPLNPFGFAMVGNELIQVRSANPQLRTDSVSADYWYKTMIAMRREFLPDSTGNRG